MTPWAWSPCFRPSVLADAVVIVETIWSPGAISSVISVETGLPAQRGNQSCLGLESTRRSTEISMTQAPTTRSTPTPPVDGNSEWPGATEKAMTEHVAQRRGGDRPTPQESEAGSMEDKGENKN